MRILCCLLLFSSFLTAGNKIVTLDDVVNYAPPPEIVPIWSPDGSAFVYQSSDAVFLYRVSNRKARHWFNLSSLQPVHKDANESQPFGWQNRRVAAHPLQWFPNNSDLLVSASGSLFVVHSGGTFDAISSGTEVVEDPELSPDGKRVVYRRKSNLYVQNLQSKGTRQLTSDGSDTLLNGQLDWVYPEELDLGTAAWWSPDSKAIAFLQFNIADEFIYPQTHLLPLRALSEPEHYPQAGTPNARVRLGVASASGGETRWMQVGDSPDVLLTRVLWLPDSSAVAVEVMPRVQNALDLVFCDPASGAAKTIVHEQSGDWINSADNLHFLKSRPQFLWTSERSGFRHLYLYSNEGTLVKQLTTGDWEVSAIQAVNENTETVYFSSSEASPLETQLFRMSLTGGERTQITKKSFDHSVHANADGSFFLDQYSSLLKTPEQVLCDASGKRLARMDEDHSANGNGPKLQRPEIVEVRTPGNPIFYARLIKPVDFKPNRKYPAIVQVYGGPGIQTVRDHWAGVDWDQYLASRGYVVWQMDNRGSTGRGHSFETPIFHNLGQQEVADQRLGVQQLLAMGFVDPDRIGIAGWSYGGYMTIHALLLAGDVFKVGVAGAPVTDWHNYDTIYTERYMGLPSENTAGYDRASNVKNAARLSGKLFLVHNIEDDNVLFQNTVQMVNALEEAGRQYVLQIYPQRTHGVTGAAQRTLYEAITDFFDRNLK